MREADDWRATINLSTGVNQKTLSREILALVKSGGLQSLDRLGRLYRITDESVLLTSSAV